MPDPEATRAAAHFQRLQRLMELEAAAEQDQLVQEVQRRSPAEAEAAGSSLIQLVIREEESGLGGRALLTLGKRNRQLSLPWSRLGVGAPVLLSPEGEPHGETGESWRGVVSRLQRETIQVAFPHWPEPSGDPTTFRLDRATDEISRQRQRQALDRARTAPNSYPLAHLREVLLGDEPPTFLPPIDYHPLDPTLNHSQQEAVRFALTAQELAVIHGPPGTGKTTTVVELIRQLTRRGETVLACAPSNLAVDNLLERLLAAGEKAVRLGHPARVLPELRAHTLDLLVQAHPDVRLAAKLTQEAHALRSQAAKFRRARPEPGARHAQRQEAKALLADARRIEAQVWERLLDGAQVVCATATGLDRELLGKRIFDSCVLDEAGQSTEPAAWIPLQFARRLVLAGDPYQLPPTVISREAAAGGFNVSLLERLVNQLGPAIARRLDVQYRMHQEIMAYSSAHFYAGTLVAHPSVAAHLLEGLPGVVADELTATPVLYVDTAGAGYDEAVEAEGGSRLNPQEASLAVAKVTALLEAGVAPGQIGVITPYSAQVKLLRQRLGESEIEVDSVDGFQGREKEAIVISLVRSNPEGEIGFLADVRRMNVALTRARRKLIVIGDSATVGVHPFYQQMIDFFESIGAYRSVWEEVY